MQSKAKIWISIVFAALAAGSLIGAILYSGTTEIAITFIVFSALCVVALVILYLYSPASNPKLGVDVEAETPGGLKGRAGLAITPTEIGRPEWTPTAIAPTVRYVDDDADRSEQEKEMLEKLANLLQQGTETDYAAAIHLLEGNKEALRQSWRLQINYGNCLIMQGQYEQARQVAEAVLHKFGHVPQAEARSHVLLILYHDSRTPDSKGKLRDEVLRQQLQHVELGIRADPTCIPLYLNEFEIRCEQDELEQALASLQRAARVDAEAAKRGISRAIEEDGELQEKLADNIQVSEFLKSLGIELGAEDDEEE